MKRILLAISFLGAAMTAPVSALDLKTPILDVYGVAVQDCAPSTPQCGTALTIGSMLVTALTANPPDDGTLLAGINAAIASGADYVVTRPLALNTAIANTPFDKLSLLRASRMIDPNPADMHVKTVVPPK